MPADKAQMKNRKRKAKPYLLTALALAIVITASFIPKIMFAMQDKSQIGQYTPLQQTGGALLANAGYYYVDVFLDTPFSGNEAVTTASNSDEIEAVINTKIANQLAAMNDAGVLPSSMFRAIQFMLSNQDLTMESVRSTGKSYTRESIFITPANRIGAQRLQATLDVDTGKIITLTMGANDIIPLDVDLRTLFESYVLWLELGDINDWIINEQSESEVDFANRTLEAYSVTTGTGIFISYEETGETTELYVEMLSL